jgi:hypothetical protein
MYTCNTCFFTSSKKSEYTRHLNTKKHIKNVSTQPIHDSNLFNCKHCEMSYKSRQGLYAHM